MRLDDLGDIFRLHLSVPHGFRIDDDRGAVLTLVETSGFVGAKGAFESALGDGGLEELVQIASGAFGAASASAAWLALVGADEDVLLEFRHVGIVSVEQLRNVFEAEVLIKALKQIHRSFDLLIRFAHSGLKV